MQLTDARVLLTGATGGLGQALSGALARRGAKVLAAGREPEALARLATHLGAGHRGVRADLNRGEGVAAVVDAARAFDVNVLINNAGIGGFGLFATQDWADIDAVLATNLVAPMRLTRALLPQLASQRAAAIVNIGSTFGSVPFAGFAAYSAAKAGLRGFSQALRRELADTGVAVVHLAPRAIATPLNTAAVDALNRELGHRSDRAEDVAEAIVAALRRGSHERHLGFPERLFARLNGIAPSLIDRGVAGKLAAIKRHAAAG